jgi:hypothetical protein
MPREVKFLAIAREFRGNGNLNPETESILFPLYDFDLRATHARKLLPAELAPVSFGFVLVRVRVLMMRKFVILAARISNQRTMNVDFKFLNSDTHKKVRDRSSEGKANGVRAQSKRPHFPPSPASPLSPLNSKKDSACAW